MYLWQRLMQNLGLHPSSRRTLTLDSDLVQFVESLAELEQRPANEVAADLLTYGLAQRDMTQDTWQRWQALSPREQQVAALTCRGYTNRQIAARLVISYETVKSHVRGVLRKFNLHSKAELRAALADWDFSAWE